ncbi:unnamed protein product [Paramecium octaurelia]|uniref:Uncharacterized protein n=1 Tax=Paramecium octaurelia TaxID=43137 RepID=A0A8S1XDU1_PAROT|nr:unnamed protein product [Paramecium octaurelia]
MFFTEPKFNNIPEIRKLIALVQGYELKYRPESPLTQKAMESLGQDRYHFRRKFHIALQ